MNEQVPQNVLEALFGADPRIRENALNLTIERIGTGLINHSWKLSKPPFPAVFLQRINHDVFADPAAIQDNYLYLWNYAESQGAGFRMPEPLRFGKGEILYKAADGSYWRAFSFIPGTKSLPTASTPEMAREAARAFAGFTAYFSKLDSQRLHTVIPSFHDLATRFSSFKASLDKPAPGRATPTGSLSAELLRREKYTRLQTYIRQSGQFPLRIMHHDAKISNVLLDASTQQVIAVVDYDTVMPGYFYSDLGDLVRSMTCQEDESQQASPVIRKDFYEAIIRGYMEGLADVLTPEEKKYIHAPGLLMTYMQTLRFLTDHHLGDRYYQVSYPGQNLERARNQFALLTGLEEFLSEAYGFII